MGRGCCNDECGFEVAVHKCIYESVSVSQEIEYAFHFPLNTSSLYERLRLEECKEAVMAVWGFFNTSLPCLSASHIFSEWFSLTIH